jgi:hypothetical protein
MLSVAHIGPGAEIEVSSTWVSALTYIGDRGRIRIPLTVGDIYGRSGLPDSDELLLGGVVQDADLFVRCSNGTVGLLGSHLTNGHARAPLNAPIDLTVTHSSAKELHGLAADGREVLLRVTPHHSGDTALNVAILIDHSGSMNEVCSDQAGSVTKHQAVVGGLISIAQILGGADIVDLWEFDTQLVHVGSSKEAAEISARRGQGRQRLLDLIARLSAPSGGTEIGNAVSGTIAGSDARDVLLITDGKSHALDVQELARMGRRITVVLVGEDSLEANVGYLSALTGGDIFVAAGIDIAEVMTTAIGSLRAPFEQPQPIDGSPRDVRVVRGNAILEAEWRPATTSVVGSLQMRAVAAFAASLSLAALGEESAAQLAEAEGLVTHLTSLVLVDDAGEAQAGLPASRKIALPHPRGTLTDAVARFSFSDDSILSEMSSFRLEQEVILLPPLQGAAALSADLSGIASRIDWDASPTKLLNGDLSALEPHDAWLIERAAAAPEAIALAKQLKIDPIVLIVALIARSHAIGNRSAARIAKAILGDAVVEELRNLAGKNGLG